MVENIHLKPGKVKPGLSEEEQRALKNKLCWRYKRRLSNILIHEEDEDRKQLGYKLRSCSTWGEIKEYVKDGYRLKYSNFTCKNILCPLCAKKKSSTRASNIQGVYNILNDVYTSKGLDDVEIFTFAISPKNIEDLETALSSCFHILDKVFGCHNRHGQFFKKSAEILGGLVSFECTRNRQDGTWHPHFHGLVFVQKQMVEKGDPWFSFNEFWVNEEKGIKFNNYWAYSLYTYINEKLKTPAFVYCAPVKSIQEGIYEGVKYAIKPNCADNEKATGLRPSESIQVYDILNKLKKRTFRTYGKLRKIDLDDEKLLDHGKEYILYKFGFDQEGNYEEQTDGVVHFDQEDQDKENEVLKKLSSAETPNQLPEDLAISDNYYFDAVAGEI